MVVFFPFKQPSDVCLILALLCLCVILPLMLTEGLNTGSQQLTALTRDDFGSSKNKTDKNAENCVFAVWDRRMLDILRIYNGDLPI